MVDLSIKKKTKKKGNKVSVNVNYDSIVRNVESDPSYKKGHAALITYEFKDSEGNIFEFKETFLLKGSNDRTYEFSDYLLENGITNLSDFIGCKEKITLLKEVKGDAVYKNIASRTFISAPNSAGDHNVGAP